MLHQSNFLKLGEDADLPTRMAEQRVTLLKGLETVKKLERFLQAITGLGAGVDEVLMEMVRHRIKVKKQLES